MKKKLIISMFLSIMLLNVGCSNASQQETTQVTTQTTTLETTQATTQTTTKKSTQTNTTSKENDINTGLLQFSPIKKGEDIAILKTNLGDMKVRFFKEQAPKAVENFLTHAKENYYDGLIFHRVIKDFMIQGGDPDGTGTGGQSIYGEPFEDEFSPYLFNFYGALSMANSGSNTNASQFFIVQNKKLDDSYKEQIDLIIEQINESPVEKNTDEYKSIINSFKKYIDIGGAPWLDGKHTVFGQVYDGLDVLDKIASVDVGANDKPSEDVIIEDIVIEKYK